MSRRDWLRYGAFAIVGIVAFVALLAIPLEYYHQYQAAQGQHAATAYQARASDKAKNACGEADGIVGRTNCLRGEIEANAADKYTEYDLKAQQQMSLWALGMLIITAAGFLVTTAGLVFIALTLTATRGMLKEAQSTTHAAHRAARSAYDGAKAAEDAARAAFDANEINRNAVLADQRPWLKWQIKSPEIQRGFFSFKVRFELILENIGKTPAMNIEYSIGLVEIGTITAVEYGKTHRNNHMQVYLQSGPENTIVSIMPTETLEPIHIRHEIPNDSILGSDGDGGIFGVLLAIHCAYGLFNQNTIGEIGSVYLIQSTTTPFGGFVKADTRHAPETVVLHESAGARLIT